MWVRPGVYRLARTFTLDARDSGSAAGRVVYAAEQTGAARLVGGCPLRPDGFRPVTDPAILARLPEKSRGKVLDAGSVPRDGDHSGRGARLTYDFDRPQRWRQAMDNAAWANFLKDPLQVRRPAPRTRPRLAGTSPPTAHSGRGQSRRPYRRFPPRWFSPTAA